MKILAAPEVELGYDLERSSWGHGLATEAARAVRDHAFEVLDLPRLVSLIRVGNDRSRRVAEKVGMRPVARLDLFGRPYGLFAVEREGALAPEASASANATDG